jgi:hypothetical protein
VVDFLNTNYNISLAIVNVLRHKTYA